MRYQTVIGEEILEFDVQITSKGAEITLEGSSIDVDCQQLSPGSFSLIINGKSNYLSITEHEGGMEVTVNQRTTLVKVKDETQIVLEKYGFNDTKKDHAGNITVPIPGLIAAIFVKQGERIEVGQKLFILEAMKMENEFDSPVSGTVSSIHVENGKSVDKGTLIMIIEVDKQ